MSTIRRQSIISSVVIYFGFAIGLVNTYFFTRQGNFTEAEYGLTTIFLAIATLMTSISLLGTPAYIYKFFPYYKDHLPDKKNDLLTWALLVSIGGFLLVATAGVIFKDLVIRKFGTNSPLLITYYDWIFPLGFGLTVYTLLEAFAWNLGKSVFTNFLREVQWRALISILIVLFVTGVLRDFGLFIALYAFTFPAIAVTLLIYLVATKKIHFTFRVSKVTRRYLGKIVALCSFVYGGTLVFTLSQVFDSFVIASVLPNGLANAGIFALASIITSIIQAPQRGIVAASIPHLSKAWKDKNMGLIQRIYERSSINQLIFASAIFLLIWMNFNDAILTFGLKPAYLDAAWVFFFLGLTRIIDMGTGVNAQIIATSTYWRFELQSGVILLLIILPLTYFLTKEYGIIGPAISHLVATTFYNGIRTGFLWKKFRLFPLTLNSALTVLLAAASYGVCYMAFHDMQGPAAMVLRSLVFILLFGAGVLYLKLSPDIRPVMQSLRKRLGI
ncbi:MAG TPA: lipopolysaccharide biosynthesis protein [Chitinophagaceae bacterium]|nr:lipopolysaccharide biosynthesis protein [Chitinophagaceae bacterium]